MEGKGRIYLKVRRAFLRQNTLFSIGTRKIASELDPRSFIDTENDDLIRCCIIGKVEHVVNFGVVIYNKQGKLIHFFHEPINHACKDITQQIVSFPTLPKEEWNQSLLTEDPDDFISPIDWDLSWFYGYRS